MFLIGCVAAATTLLIKDQVVMPTYTRSACHPPIAEPGLIRFRIFLNANDWVWLRFENRSYAPASSGRHEMPFRSIPLPPLAPGTYSFQWTATYRCKGSSGPLTVESPKLAFTVS